MLQPPRTAGTDGGMGTLRSTRGGRSPDRGRAYLALTPEDVAGAWDCVAALGLPPHVRTLLEDAKVAQARARAPRTPLVGRSVTPHARARSLARLCRSAR